MQLYLSEECDCGFRRVQLIHLQRFSKPTKYLFTMSNEWTISVSDNMYWKPSMAVIQYLQWQRWMLLLAQLSPDPWKREYVVGKHLLYTACNFEMLIARRRGNMEAMMGNCKLWKIRIDMVFGVVICQMYLLPRFGQWIARSENLSITHPFVHYHFIGFHTNWVNFSANTLYFPTTPICQL